MGASADSVVSLVLTGGGGTCSDPKSGQVWELDGEPREVSKADAKRLLADPVVSFREVKA